MCIQPAGSLAGAGCPEVASITCVGSQLGQPEWLRLPGLPLHVVFHPSFICSIAVMVQRDRSHSCKASAALALKA